MALICGCQKYRPIAIDLNHHLDTWQNVNVESINSDQQVSQLDHFNKIPSISVEDGISLNEAESIMLFFNANLRTKRAEISMFQALAEKSGIPGDVGIDFDFPKIINPGDFDKAWESSLKLPLPLFGRLKREKEKAWADYNVMERQVAALEWSAIINLRSLWVEWSGLYGKTELTKKYLAQLNNVRSSVSQLASVGELDSTEARVLEIEHAGMQTELIDLQTKMETVRQEILNSLGLHPQTKTKFNPKTTLFQGETFEKIKTLEISENHPLLARFQAAYEASEKELHLEISKQYPDLVLSPSYGDENGRIGFGFSFVLPLWNQNKKAIAKATKNREVARKLLEAVYEDLIHQLDLSLKRFKASQSIGEIIEEKTIPLADLQLDEIQKLLEIGEINVLLIKDALNGSLQSKKEFLDIHVERSKAANAIHAILGPASWVPVDKKGKEK